MKIKHFLFLDVSSLDSYFDGRRLDDIRSDIVLLSDSGGCRTKRETNSSRQEGEPGEYKRRYLPPERAENQREYPNRGADGLCPQQGLPPAQCPRGVTSLLLTIPYPTGLRRGYHHCPEAAGF